MPKKIILKALIVAILWIIWIWNIYAQPSWFWDNALVSWYQVPGTPKWTTWSNNDEKLLEVIQKAVNRVLWMLSLVALILCIRGWFQMLTAGSDDWKVKSWTKILKNAALWLAIIWLSWLLVSFVFRIVNKTTWWVS